MLNFLILFCLINLDVFDQNDNAFSLMNTFLFGNVCRSLDFLANFEFVSLHCLFFWYIVLDLLYFRTTMLYKVMWIKEKIDNTLNAIRLHFPITKDRAFLSV